jgi:hypothetical protein
MTMSIRGERFAPPPLTEATSSATDPVATTTTELIAQLQRETLDDQAGTSRELAQLSRGLRRDAQQAQVAEQRRQAEQQLIGGILRGVGSIVQGACAIGASSAGAGSAGGQGAGGAGASGADGASALWSGGSQLVNGGLGIGAAAVDAEAAYAGVRARTAEHRAEDAAETAQTARDDLRAAHDAQTRATQSLAEVLREQRRAEEAATRA